MTDTTPIRWAVSGVGGAGRRRARAILRDERCSLAALHKGHHVGDFDVPAVSSLSEAIRLADAVAICSPSEVHAEQVAACLEAKRHVVVEYPLALGVRQAKELFDRARVAERILHVAHVELMGGVAETLRAHVRPESVRKITVHFERAAPGDISGYKLAFSNVARLHTVVNVAGPIAAITDVSAGAGRLEATFTLRSGAKGKLTFYEGPYFTRKTVLEIDEVEGTWRQENRALFRGASPQTLVESEPVFVADHAWFMRRVLTRAPHYVADETILHVLQVAEMLRDGRVGNVPE